ncbi:MAG: hypothetical protein WCA35_30180, partial [Kovacikia sp.]
VENYLLHAYPWQLKRDAIESEFKQVLYDSEADPEQIRQQLEGLNADYFKQVLKQRDDLKSAKIHKIADRLETVRQTVLASLEKPNPDQLDQPDQPELQHRLQTESEKLWQTFATYLRDPEQNLTARKIQRQFKRLLKQSPPELTDLRQPLPDLNRQQIVDVLEERQDLTEKRVQQVANQVKKVWSSLLEGSNNTITPAKRSYTQITQAVSTEGEQANGSEPALTSLQKAPRRFASRTQTILKSFRSVLEDYLRHIDKAELNPEGIQQDLKQLLQDPKAGLEQLGDRLAEFDRATLIDWLTQRGDLSETEMNQIVDQIEAARQQVLEQVQMTQARLQELIENLLEKIRSYFTSLTLPELNYEDIQADFKALLNSSQEGFEAIGTRLSHWNHDTLTTLLSARQDISQFVADQIADRTEAVRLQLLEQLERVRQEADNRVQELKQRAQQQAEATRRAAAIAAWWLFSIVFSSAITAAIAGAIAVKGLANW